MWSQIIYIQNICMNRVWHWISYNDWYKTKPNQLRSATLACSALFRVDFVCIKISAAHSSAFPSCTISNIFGIVIINNYSILHLVLFLQQRFCLSILRPSSGVQSVEEKLVLKRFCNFKFDFQISILLSLVIKKALYNPFWLLLARVRERERERGGREKRLRLRLIIEFQYSRV